MARLFPSDLESGTGVEERLAVHLGRVLVPDDVHWIWFRPTLPSGTPDASGSREVRPAFVLLGSPYGLVVLGTCWWRRQEIEGATDRSLRVRLGSGSAAHRPRPEIGTWKAAESLARRLRDLPGTAGVDGVGWGVAYPRFSQEDARRLAEDGVVDPDRILTREELTAARFEGSLARIARGTRTGELGPGVRARLRALIEPQIHFMDLREVAPEPRTAMPPAGPPPTPSDALPGFWLDRKQERIARELASPRTLVYGPAGSGKTVFLVARAQYWLDRNPAARVLFTCYNASLASHLRQLFAARGIEAEDARLTVRHYHDLCGRFLGLSDIHEQSPEFYAALEPRVLRELVHRDEVPVYDCVLVDEGQDFTRRMIEVLVRWNAPGGEITVVCDPAQDIYGRWRPENLGPLREPAVEHLMDCYRNTAPIFALALAVLPANTRRVLGLNRLEMTRPEDLGRDGSPPELRELGGLDDLAGMLVTLAGEFAREGLPLSDLAVLYTDRHAVGEFSERLRASSWKAARDPRFSSIEEGEEARDRDRSRGSLHPASDRDDLPPSPRPHFAQALELELCARGVPTEWISRDFEAKAGYDITRSRLTLSTIHSAKGMDFHTVVLLGAESLPTRTGRDRERAEALLFTGITRARERLLVPYFADRGWIPEIRSRLI